jgi:hypothetical protein
MEICVEWLRNWRLLIEKAIDIRHQYKKQMEAVVLIQ